MDYTVIARRWRPKRFDDIIGQPHIITTIKNSIKYGRIPHAYLFTGPRGVGKTSLARILAKAVNCVNGPIEEPCGVCENCIAIADGKFVDLIEIDAASKRKLIHMRDMIDTVGYMPMKGRYKVYILDESHMLIDEAWNAFLKTLEEPPRHNIFILSTTQPEDVPYTIMSRCQRFDFRRISEADIEEQLKRICKDEDITYDERAFQYIAVEADGSLRDAESMLDQIIAYCGKHISEKDVIDIIGIVERDVLYGIVKSILDGNLKAGLEIIENTLSRGYDVYQIYKGLIYILRNMMIMKVCEGVPPFLYIGEDEYKRVAVLLKDLEYYEIQNMLHYMLKAEDLLRGFFPKVSLEILYINLYNLTKLRDVERIIDNLGKHSYKKDEGHGHDIDETVEHGSGQDIKGFIEYLKKKKPLIGSIFDTLQINIEGDNVIVYMDKNSNLIRGDARQKEEIKKCLKEFFGKEMGLILKDAGEIKKNILDEYVKEAGTLFKV